MKLAVVQEAWECRINRFVVFNHLPNILIGWLVVLFYGVLNLFRSFNAELNFKHIQFSISIVLVYKQLNVKTLLFQATQFSISTQFSSIQPIDRTLSGATTRARVDHGAMAMNGNFAFPKAPELLEPHHQIVECHTQETRWVGLTPLQRSCLSILQPQPTGQPIYIYILYILYIVYLGSKSLSKHFRLKFTDCFLFKIFK